MESKMGSEVIKFLANSGAPEGNGDSVHVGGLVSIFRAVSLLKGRQA